MSKIIINLKRQDPSSNDCLRCCGLMVLNFLGDKISTEEIWNKLHVYKKHSGLLGCYLQDLGALAQKRGFVSTIYHGDWQWWDKPTVLAQTKGKTKLLAALKILKRNKKKWQDKKLVTKEIKYLQKGGSIIFQLPKLATIDFFLKKNLPSIIFINAADLYHDPKENYSHAILIVGKENNNYLIKDPYLAVEKISQEELQYAWSRNGGWMMVIRPKRKKNQLPLFR